MKFFKNLFDDESTVIGLCGFKLEKTKVGGKTFTNDMFFNPFKPERVFETDFTKNIFLSV